MIRQIRNKVEITAALSLIWETFLQFEAPDYSDEGVKIMAEGGNIQMKIESTFAAFL